MRPTRVAHLDPVFTTATLVEAPREPNFKITLSEVDEAAELQVDQWISLEKKKTSKDAHEEAKIEGMKGDHSLVKKLLSKAEEIREEDVDEKEFFQREASLAAPIPGKLVNLPFPPPQKERKQMEFDPKDLDLTEVAEDVQITQNWPQGIVSYSVSRMKIGFNQPMIAVGSVDDVAEQHANLGITIEPEAKGEWRWSGSKLCQFMTQHRFRLSTEYTCFVPKGLKSALGGELKEEKKWTFKTPTLRADKIHFAPARYLDPILYAVFNQDVRKEVIYEKSLVDAGELKLIPIQPDKEEDLKAIPNVDRREQVKSWWQSLPERDQRRAICFRFSEELKKNTNYSYILRKGAVCGEGPLPSEQDIRATHRTYPPLTITSHYPSKRVKHHASYPDSSWSVTFSNTLNRRTVKKSHITVSPAIKGMKVSVSGTSVNISHNDLELGVEYKVTFSREIRDQWGQSLSDKNAVVIKKTIERPPPPKADFGDLYGEENLMTMDPFNDNPEYLCRVANFEELKVSVRHVSPSDYRSSMWDHRRDWTSGKTSLPGKKATSFTIEVKEAKSFRNDMVPLRIPVGKFFQDQKTKLGHIFLMIEPTESAFKRNSKDYLTYEDRPVIYVWLQRTLMCVDMICNNSESPSLFAWATDMKTGAPLEDVKISSTTASARTNADGIANFGSYRSRKWDSFVAEAKCKYGPDSCIAVGSPSKNSFSYYTARIFDDRKLYKPKEKVNMKGFMRHMRTSKDGAFLPHFTKGLILWNAYGPRQNEIAKGECKLNKFGAFAIEFELPDNINTGDGNVKFYHKDSGSQSRCTFQIQEYRKPEFSIKASYRPPGVHQYALPTSEDWGELKQKEQAEAGDLLKKMIESIKTLREKERQLLIEAAEEKDEDIPEPTNEEKEKAAEELAKTVSELKEKFAPKKRSFVAGETPCVIASVQADYYSGGALSDAKVQWDVSAQESSYTPPKHWEFTFGKQERWWYMRHHDETFGSVSAPIQASRSIFESKTDMDGNAEVAISWEGLGLKKNSCKPVTVTAKSLVRDMNYQAKQDSVSFLIHPCRYYVGFKLEKGFGSVGSPFKASIVVVDPDGKRVSGVPVTCIFEGSAKMKMEDSAGLLVQKTVHKISETTVVTSNDVAEKKKEGEGDDKANLAEFQTVPKMPGSYTLKVRVYDKFGGWHESVSTSIWIKGPKTADEPQGFAYDKLSHFVLPCDSLTIIPDKQTYQPGDIAKIVIRSPLSDAHGMMIVRCHGMKGDPIPFKIPKGAESTTLELKMQKQWIPGISLVAWVTSAVPRETDIGGGKPAKDDLRPAFAVGEIELNISSKCYGLSLEIQPKDEEKDEVGPGKTIHPSVVVKDFAGNPVSNAEVCFVMVDEAVLSLTGYNLLPNPLEGIFPSRTRPDTASVIHGRRTVRLLPRATLKEVKEEVLEDSDSDACEDFYAYDIVAPCSMAMMQRLERKASGVQLEAEGLGLDNDNKIAVRKNFNPLAAFVPSVVTDENGVAKLEVTLPDSLTRYRVWALACTEVQFGTNETSVSVSLPLMVRPSPPRFLNFGDKCAVSVVLQNQTENDLTALIAARGTLVSVDQNQAAAKVTLKKLQRGVVHFGVEALKVGVARMQFVSSSKGVADAAEVSFEVYTPATREGFATYGSVDFDGQDSDVMDPASDVKMESSDPTKPHYVVQPIKPPKEVWPQFGGLEITTSTTQFQHLEDAVISLYNYTYECSEQLASRLLGMVSVREVMEAFNSARLPPMKVIQKKTSKWLETLKKRQHDNGGFWTWGPPKFYGYETLPGPYMSVHVACCLAHMEERKQPIDRRMKLMSQEYVKNIEARIDAIPYSRHWSKRTRNAIIAYALYVRKRWNMKDVVAQAASFVEKDGGKNGKGDYENLTPEAIAWCLVALSGGQSNKLHQRLIKDLKAALLKHITEEADTAYFTTSYGDDGSSVMLHSSRRTDAAVLEALVEVDGNKNGLSPKLCKGLLKQKKKEGGWSTTQENCFVLMALLRYFKVYEKHVPDFTISLWYGDLFGGKQEWKGRSTESKSILVAMKGLQALGDNNFIIHKLGKGRLYYRMGLTYAPKSLELAAANYGFLVSRTYKGVDDKAHARFDDEKKMWVFALGERIEVTVTMTTTARRYHMALCDYLPAGCEPLNPALKGSPSPSAGSTGGSGGMLGNPHSWRFYSKRYWPEHINLRNERAEAFRSLLWPGVYEFVYTVRATTGGDFVVPPALAEEMYSPECFGRSASGKVRIE